MPESKAELVGVATRAGVATHRRRVVAVPPGEHLRTAVDAVLAELGGAEPGTAAPDRQALLRCADRLRGALARTAAVGDTCRVLQAVRAVRSARASLAAANPAEARAALQTARAGLATSLPVQR